MRLRRQDVLEQIGFESRLASRLGFFIAPFNALVAAFDKLFVARIVRRLHRPEREVDPELRDRLFAPGEQPFAQQMGRSAVVAVIGFNILEDALVARLKPALKHDDRLVALLDLRLAIQSIEALELLDAVAVFGDNERLTDDGVEIDKASARSRSSSASSRVQCSCASLRSAVFS